MRSLLYEIADVREKLLYYIHGDDGCGYGLEIVQIEGEKFTRRASGFVFKRKSTAKDFLKALYEGRVYPVHLCDIIEDERENIEKMQ